MGDTSCGKSSLLSALSGIEFPSSEKLTTRCPTQIIMNNNKNVGGEFSATVELRRYSLKDSDKPRDVQSLSSLDEIRSSIENITADLIKEGQEISDDCIVITAHGPELPNLTLIDLPGLVRTVKDGESESMIPRIRALVKRYLDQSRTIILSVVPANVDIHNTEILTLAKEVDEGGNRTICVITKPDLVDKGAEESVIDLLMNKTRKLKLFYHAVKCRGQNALKNCATISDGITDEKTFFSSTAPWNNVRKDLVGIENLKMKLSKLLEIRIRESLPSMRKEITARVDAASADLFSIGPALNDSLSRRQFYLNVVDDLCIRLDGAVHGKYDYGQVADFFRDDSKKLRATIHSADQVFKEAITRIIIPLDVSEMCYGDTVEFFYGNKWVSDGKVGSYGEVSTSITFFDATLKKFSVNLENYKIRPPLTEIKKTISLNKSDGLQIFASNSVLVMFIQEKIRLWEEPMNELLDAYIDNLNSCLVNLVNIVSVPKLKKFFEIVLIQDFVAELRAVTKLLLKEKLVQEMRPFTLNQDLNDKLSILRNRFIREQIKAIPQDGNDQVHKRTVLQVIDVSLDPKSVDDWEAMELLMAASTYLKVAKVRFIDDIPMILNDNIMNAALIFVKKNNKKLNLDDEALESILEENFDQKETREELENKIKSLNFARDLLNRERLL